MDQDQVVEFLPAELLEDGVITPEVKPEATPAAPSEEERQRIAMEYMRSNPTMFNHQNPVQAPYVQQPQQEKEEIEYDDDGNETAASYIKRTIKDSVTQAVGAARQQWVEEFIPAQGQLAAENIIASVVNQYKLNDVEQRELREVIKNVSPDALVRSLGNPEAQKSFAAMAKGRAFLSTPQTVAPAVRPSTGLQFAPGITKEGIESYMKWNGITKLGPKHIESLKKDGLIING